MIQAGRRVLAVLVMTAAGVGSCVTACDPTPLAAGLYGACQDDGGRTAERLLAREELDLAPPDVEPEEKASKQPCEDEAGIGTVSRGFATKGQNDEIRAYYKTAFTDHGWQQRYEAPLEPLDVSKPYTTSVHVCFERPDMPGVILGLHFSPFDPLSYSIGFDYGKPDLTCPTG
ncbi:hypothetical protein [Actinokineospora cianjurensis]|uniref:LppP/LprE lipoprotein n=1 Tax=Actinokineospora cianjurensis TaxID=585224 RepID=A0A421B2L4_9PSEU|nr:hypothetical protein [Actinokineospora cianjurensis]RLK58666.1 hypothetical protein CLV68_3138 [Actinokineospora cianjurensis]